MNFKNLKIASKLGLGFGILILIAVILGIIAVTNMSSINKRAALLADGHAVELEISDRIQNSALMAMMELRAYILTDEENYLNNGTRYLTAIHEETNKAKELSNQFEELVKLKQKVNSTAIYEIKQEMKYLLEYNVKRKNLIIMFNFKYMYYEKSVF